MSAGVSRQLAEWVAGLGYDDIPPEVREHLQYCLLDAFGCGLDSVCWDGICEPKHVLGEPCENMQDCVFGLFCSDEGACYDPFG